MQKNPVDLRGAAQLGANQECLAENMWCNYFSAALNYEFKKNTNNTFIKSCVFWLRY